MGSAEKGTHVPRELNKIDGKVGANEVARYTKYLAGKIDSGPPSGDPGRGRYFALVGHYSMWLGLYEYMLEGSDAVIATHFMRAMRAYQSMLELRAKPEGPTGGRELREFEQTLAFAACFGDSACTRALSRLEEWAYRDPIRSETDAYAAYLGALKFVVANEEKDHSEAKRALDACRAANQARDVPVEIADRIFALLALVDGDAIGFNRHLAAVVRNHVVDARSGELSDMQEGFICLEALGLSGLAKRQGVPVTVNSVYLPLSLLDARPV